MLIIGLHGCMLFLSTACSLGKKNHEIDDYYIPLMILYPHSSGAVYVFFVLKETKGIPLDTVSSKEKKSTETLETIVNGR